MPGVRASRLLFDLRLGCYHDLQWRMSGDPCEQIEAGFLRLPTEVRLGTFGFLYDDLLNSLWLMPYFSLDDSLHDVTHLGHTRGYKRRRKAHSRHNKLSPLLICKATYPQALIALSERIHPIVDVVCQGNDPRRCNPLPQGLDTPHLKLVKDLHLNIVPTYGNETTTAMNRLEAFLEAIDFAVRMERLTICFHGRRWPLSGEAI